MKNFLGVKFGVPTGVVKSVAEGKLVANQKSHTGTVVVVGLSAATIGLLVWLKLRKKS